MICCIVENSIDRKSELELSKLETILPYLAGTGVAFTWGFSFMFTRGALDYLEPFHLLGLRFGAAVIAMSLLRTTGLVKINLKPTDYLNLLPLAIFQPIIYFSAETAGIQHTSSAYAGMMIAIIPIFVAMFAAIFLQEYPNRLQLLFIIASVSGAVFIVFMDTRSITGAGPLGTALLMVAVIAGAGFNIFSRKASLLYSPLQITWVMMVVGAVSFNTISLFQHFNSGQLQVFFTPLGDMWISILYLGIFSSVAAFFLYNYVLSKITATQGSVFANMVTVVAISAGVLFRGEQVSWYHLVGTAAILAGVWGTNRYAPASVVPETDRDNYAGKTGKGSN